MEKSDIVFKSFSFLVDNADVIFSGIGVAALGWFVNSKKSKSNEPDNHQDNTTVNNISIENKFDTQTSNQHSNDNKDDNVDEDTIKSVTQILFIDDDTRFKVVKILNKSGWVNCKLIKDVDSLDSVDIIKANIIFVDVQGVGVELNFKEEGLGLASALKEKYPDKKIIIYSAEQTGNRFHHALRQVDDFLPKDADPYQFTSVVEKFAGINNGL